MKKRIPLAAANWKMNLGIGAAKAFVAEFVSHQFPRDVEIVLCPTFTSLAAVVEAFAANNKIAVGAQNCSSEEKGAFTGEVSPVFLREMGCSYVIVGHSERRQIFKEDNTTIAKKLKVVFKLGMVPIFCIGETETERDGGHTYEVIHKQLTTGLAQLTPNEIERAVIAYEPVWAIGTGRTATPDQAEDVHKYIRDWLEKRFHVALAQKVRILYGGSVKPDNIKALMAMEDIDGALVGGASLKVEDFVRIVQGCE